MRRNELAKIIPFVRKGLLLSNEVAIHGDNIDYNVVYNTYVYTYIVRYTIIYIYTYVYTIY